VEWVASGDLREADTAQEILKPGVGSDRIEGWPQQDGGVEARLIGLFQPDHRPVQIAEPHIDQGNIGVGGRVSILLVQDKGSPALSLRIGLPEPLPKLDVVAVWVADLRP
jgi:hypothetical protein